MSSYLLRYFVSLFCLVLPGLSGLYLLAELFEKLDDFLEAGVSFSSTILYFILLVPSIVYQLTPLAVLFAGLLSLTVLSRSMELVAMRSVGVPPGRIIRPFLFAALAVALCLVALKAFVIPGAIARADALFQIEVKKKPPKGVLVGNQLFYREGNTILSTRLDNPSASRLGSVELFSFDDRFRMKGFMAARQASYQGRGRWLLDKALVASGGNGGGISFYPEKTMDLPLHPADLVALKIPAEEKGLFVLARHILSLRKSGIDARQEEALFWGQFLYCFLGVSLLWASLPLIMFKARGGVLSGLGIGLIIGFSSWVLWNFAVTLGKTGKLPAAAAVMAVHAMLFVVGLFMFRRMRY